METIITRMWHGITKIEVADEYLNYLEETAIKDYKSIPGNLSVEVWRRKEKDVCHFWTVTKWKNVEGIKEFAGEAYEKARYYEKDKKFLLEFEVNVIHSETYIF